MRSDKLEYSGYIDRPSSSLYNAEQNALYFHTKIMAYSNRPFFNTLCTRRILSEKKPKNKYTAIYINCMMCQHSCTLCSRCQNSFELRKCLFYMSKEFILHIYGFLMFNRCSCRPSQETNILFGLRGYSKNCCLLVHRRKLLVVSPLEVPLE